MNVHGHSRADSDGRSGREDGDIAFPRGLLEARTATGDSFAKRRPTFAIIRKPTLDPGFHHSYITGKPPPIDGRIVLVYSGAGVKAHRIVLPPEFGVLGA